MTNYIPSDTHTITPHIILKNVSKAIEFYKEVFDAKELYRMPMPDGSIMHACVQIGDSKVFFADEMPVSRCGMASPETLKGNSVTMHLYVSDVDKVFQRAIDAGAKSEMQPADMFWGDRYGRLTDPFGQAWSIATHKEDLTPEETARRGAECMKQMATAAK